MFGTPWHKSTSLASFPSSPCFSTKGAVKPTSVKAKLQRTKPLDISFGMIEIPFEKVAICGAIKICSEVVSQCHMLCCRLRKSKLQEDFPLPRCLENAPLLVFAVQVKFSSSQNHPKTLFVHKQTVPQTRFKRWKMHLPSYPMLHDDNPTYQLIHSKILMVSNLFASQ